MGNKVELFEDVWLSVESRDKTLKRWGTIFLSFGIHILIMFFALYGPLISTETNLPELKIVDVYLSIVPKPPASMRGAKKKTQKKTKVIKEEKQIKKKELVSPSALIVPIEIPGEIIDEDEEYLVSDIDFGDGGGVEGGTEGGSEGGIVGGSDLGETVEEEIEPVRVSGLPELIKKVIPIYPPEAIRRRVRDRIIIEIITGKFGNVKKCKVIHGHPLLNKAALDAVRQWRYKPYLVKGKPTPIIATILVEFTSAN